MEKPHELLSCDFGFICCSLLVGKDFIGFFKDAYFNKRYLLTYQFKELWVVKIKVYEKVCMLDLP